MTEQVSGYLRAGGALGARNQVLVLPSVVCATRVALDVATATGAVTVVHQLGCSQVGDDASRTTLAFEGLATNPNFGGVVVISLGCETLQGRRLASRIEARGQRLEFVEIQAAGGSERARSLGHDAAVRMAAELSRCELTQCDDGQATIGVEADSPNARVERFIDHALEAGAALIVADGTVRGFHAASGAQRHQAFDPVAARSGLTVLDDAGEGLQQHAALSAAGAAVIVSFPAPTAAPVGFPGCPVIAVAGDSSLHRALVDDFDATASDSPAELWKLTLRVYGGAAVRAERWRQTTMALERLAMTL